MARRGGHFPGAATGQCSLRADVPGAEPDLGRRAGGCGRTLGRRADNCRGLGVSGSLPTIARAAATPRELSMLPMPPAISVVIPAHNAGDTLGDTLASLYAQTFAAWEALVVDDGSSDDTAEVAAAWAARDLRIRVLGRSQGGVSAARNDGIAEARHDWLLFLDADDRLDPDHLSRM